MTAVGPASAAHPLDLTELRDPREQIQKEKSAFHAGTYLLVCPNSGIVAARYFHNRLSFPHFTLSVYCTYTF